MMYVECWAVVFDGDSDIKPFVLSFFSTRFEALQYLQAVRGVPNLGFNGDLFSVVYLKSQDYCPINDAANNER